MKKLICGFALLAMSMTADAAGYLVNAIDASVKHIDAASKTVTVETKDGVEHTFRVVGRTTVHGAEATPGAARDSLHGLQEGSEVVVHYTKRGTVETAEEIDRIGDGGLKETKGTLSKLDRGGKKIVVKGDDGAEHAFDLSDNAARDAGKDIAKGSENGAKVTVYYADTGGKKVAHFFKKVV
jgi:hypothetical protein